MIPDVEELLPTDIAAGKRKLHARKHVAIRRDVAGSVTGTTRKTVQGVFARCRRRSAEFFHVAHQFLVMEDLLEVRTGNSQGEDGCVSVHFGVMVGASVYTNPNSFASAITPAWSEKLPAMRTLAMVTFSPWDFKNRIARMVRFSDPGSFVMAS